MNALIVEDLFISGRGSAGKIRSECLPFTEWHVSEEILDSLVRRQVFCSDYIDGEERLREQSLPPMALFYDRINNIHISQSEYDPAKQLCGHFMG